MRKTLLASIGLALLLSSCVKQISAPVATSVTVISQITSDDLDYGGGSVYYPNQVVTDFTYNGKLLSAANTRHQYGYPPNVDGIVTKFTYNSTGQLAGTSIAISSGYPPQGTDIVSSAVTYSGNHISTISFYHRDQTLNRTFTLTYNDDLLKQIYEPNSKRITYTYDSKGNNLNELDEEFANGVPNGQKSQLINSTFDTNANLSSLFPMWIYFKCYSMALSHQNVSANQFDAEVLSESLTFTTGKNNPSNTCNSGNSFTYSYVYDDNGYPTAITYPNLFSNKYVYTQVN